MKTHEEFIKEVTGASRESTLAERTHDALQEQDAPCVLGESEEMSDGS